MDAYERLREKIDTNVPIPTPKTESGVEIEILKRLMTIEEAETGCLLSGVPESAAAIAQREGRDVSQLIKTLDEMARKGVIFKVYAEEPLYSLSAMLPGIYEYQVNRLAPDMVELFERYYANGQGEAIFSNKTPFSRVVAVKRSITSELNVLTHDEVENLIDNATSVTLADCICRTNKKLVGEGCDNPSDDICILLDSWADYYAENGLGRKVSREEGKDALQRAEDAGLVHCALNVQQGSLFLCNCCGCCCALLRGITELKIPGAVAKSSFVAEIDEDACIGCGDCEDLCQVQAIELEDDLAVLVMERCIGCGVCASNCPSEAISLRKRQDAGDPPADMNELMMNIAQGRAEGAAGG